MNQIREKYYSFSKTFSLHIKNNKISSIDNGILSKTGYRIYKDGILGIAGAYGKADDEEYFSKAEKNLRYKLPYPVEPTQNTKSEISIDECSLDEKSLIDGVKEIVNYISENHQDFMVGIDVSLNTSHLLLENEVSTHLSFKDHEVSMTFFLRKKGSTDYLDIPFIYMDRYLDIDKINKSITELINAYNTPVNLPEEKLPVIMHQSDLTGFISSHLYGKRFADGASFFDGQLGKNIFNPAFSYKIDLDYKHTYSPTFDSEGTIPTEENTWLIREGQLIRPYSDKQTSKAYGYTNTGSAGGDVDDLPILKVPDTKIVSSDCSLKELLNGKKGILCLFYHGGNYTPDGRYASPVQLAYLTDGEKLLGRLPRFSLRNNIYDIFGKDYIGTSSNKIFKAFNNNMTVVNMELADL